MDAFGKAVESLRSSSHTDNYRHRRQLISGRAFKEFLHYGRVLGKVCGLLCAAVSFVYDEIQPVRLLTDGVGKSLPDRILPSVGVLGQVARFRELLSVQEIDMPVLKDFHIKGIIADRYALVQSDLISLEVYFEL